MSLGTVVVRGYSFEIISIRLYGGQLHFTAQRPGPLPALNNEPATIFGEDGQGFCQGTDAPGGSITISEARAGQTAVVTLHLKMIEVAGA